MLLIPQWLLPNRLILAVGEMPSFSTGYRLVTRVLHTHVHLLGDDEAFCATCYTSLTVNHMLIECPRFNHLRQQYHFGSTLKELFSNTSVNYIIAFIKIPIFILAYNRCCTSFILAISLGFNNLFL